MENLDSIGLFWILALGSYSGIVSDWTLCSGLAYFSAGIVTKITQKLADNCVESDDNFDSLLSVHKDFEKW